MVLFALFAASALAQEAARPRAREAGVVIGTLSPGPLNAITDVDGVRVGHTTVIRGNDVRTGVTAILPHGGNIFQERVPGAIFVGNGFGKLMGSTQVAELGEIESPILLTNTLNVGRVADAAIDYMLALPGNEMVRSINIIVGETNDGRLNDIRGRHVSREHVINAIRNAKTGPVEEGNVGAGTGTIAFGFKGGIGTSSRRVGAYTVGVLVQTNFGGDLTINGVPVARELQAARTASADGSIMIVIATDAPVDARNLERMGVRAIMGLARTGASGSHGSGDYAIAFSTARSPEKLLRNDNVSALFVATMDATEEAILNSLFKATSVKDVPALPLDETLAILRRHGALTPARSGG